MTFLPSSDDDSAERTVGFGPFQLALTRKLLLEEGRPVHLGGRALDILIALVSRAGETVSRDELVAFAWPHVVVEESSLRVHISALRKVLGDGQGGARYIVNQPGRGYCFIAPVRLQLDARPLEAAPPVQWHALALPSRLVRMLGRNDAVATLGARLRARRFVTLLGPGGIGKTTVALAAADVYGKSYAHGARFVDFAPVADGQLVGSTVAIGLGLSASPADATARIANFLRDQHVLLVLDNCEHLVDAVVPLVAALLQGVPRLDILATSREALRAEGEWLQRLPALTVPPLGEPLGADEALSFSAIELFVERATASVDSFELRDRDVPLVAELCRRLDGNPLAIELAAARIDLFGLRGLSEQLDAHILQLKRGRRGAAARHETLGIMLDWSFQLLTPAQREILELLSIFPGRFPLAAAVALTRSLSPGQCASDEAVFDVLVDLTSKSLLTNDATGESVYFRLLELPRAHALGQLKSSGRHTVVSRKHAEYVLAYIDEAAKVWPTVSNTDWRVTYGWVVDDIRAVLAWAFSDEGDVLIGSSLAVCVWPLIGEASPFDEPASIERALSALANLPSRQPELEMRLNIAIAMKFQIQQGNIEEAEPFNARALELAKLCDSPELEAEAQMIRVAGALAVGNYQLAVGHHAGLHAAAQRSKNSLHALVADRMGAQVQHLAGHHDEGLRLARRVLSHPIRKGPMKSVGGAVDHAVSMRIMASRILWVQGFADQAMALVKETLERAAADDSLALCQAFSLAACPIALWCGDVAWARDLIGRFHAVSSRHVTGGVWLPTSAAIPWWLVPVGEGVPGGAASAPWLEAPGNLLQLDHLATAHVGFASPAAAARALGNEAGWCAPELLRAQGERLLQHGRSPAALEEARRLFERSLEVANQQCAPAWALRSATSLARLLQGLGRHADARAVLAPVHARFSEGFETADLVAAAALLR